MLDKIVKRNEDVAWRMIEGEVIIISPEDSTQHYLNEVGSMIWDLADGKRSVQDIIDHMKKEYQVDEKELADDVIEFVKNLSSPELKLLILE